MAVRLAGVILGLGLVLLGGCAAGISWAERPLAGGLDAAAAVAERPLEVAPVLGQVIRPQPRLLVDDGPLPPTAEPATPTPTPAPTVAPTPTPRQRPPGTASKRPPGTVPILMYHYVRVNPDPADRIGFGLSASPQDFAAQMAFLAERGYETVLLHDLAGEEAKRGNAVAITFDDGYADAYDVAYPILRRYGFKATFYVITGLVGRPGYLTWEQIRALAAEGNAIGSHSVGHPDLRTLGDAALGFQLRESKAELERQLGKAVVDFCYPAGKFSKAVAASAGQAGYASAVTTGYGWYAPGADPLALPRVRIAGGTSLADFADLIGESPP